MSYGDWAQWKRRVVAENKKRGLGAVTHVVCHRCVGQPRACSSDAREHERWAELHPTPWLLDLSKSRDQEGWSAEKILRESGGFWAGR